MHSTLSGDSKMQWCELEGTKHVWTLLVTWDHIQDCDRLYLYGWAFHFFLLEMPAIEIECQVYRAWKRLSGHVHQQTATGEITIWRCDSKDTNTGVLNKLGCIVCQQVGCDTFFISKIFVVAGRIWSALLIYVPGPDVHADHPTTRLCLAALTALLRLGSGALNKCVVHFVHLHLQTIWLLFGFRNFRKRTTRFYLSGLNQFLLLWSDGMIPGSSYINKIKTIGWKKRSIGSKAQKKTNKITKFMSNVFL